MKYITLLYLVSTIIFNYACTDKKNLNSDTKRNPTTQTNLTDTLKFKTGIRSILQDSKGNYWFGSDQEGVCMYDGKNFTYYTTENDFCGKQVIYIKEDETGLIWFGTSSGLCCFDGNKFTSNEKMYPLNNSDGKHYAGWQLSTNNLWFPGINKNELIRINNGKSYTIKYPIQISLKENSVDYGITGFSKSKNGGLWVAHYSGVSYYDGKKIQFINDSTMHYDGKSKYMHVRSILEDSQGRLWIGNNGIGVQLKEKGAMIHFSEKYNVFKGDIFRVKSAEGTLMHVFAIKEDSKGNIWFGDRDTGAWKFDGKELKNFKLDTTLNTQHIWDIFEDRSGNLLFASGDRGVYKFTGNGFDRMF
ncbi:MAG: two-component regulator propeller domain-containing protein [Bacteroidia bacterium]